MIAAQDLRIGNWVMAPANFAEYGAGDELVYYLIDDYRRIGNAPWIDPIPLTPEILLKCGFDTGIEGNEYFYRYKGYLTIVFINPENGIVILNRNDDDFALKTVDIKYLHQLQNAWPYWLGVELQIQLP